MYTQGLTRSENHFMPHHSSSSPKILNPGTIQNKGKNLYCMSQNSYYIHIRSIKTPQSRLYLLGQREILLLLFIYLFTYLFITSSKVLEVFAYEGYKRTWTGKVPILNVWVMWWRNTYNTGQHPGIVSKTRCCPILAYSEQVVEHPLYPEATKQALGQYFIYVLPCPTSLNSSVIFCPLGHSPAILQSKEILGQVSKRPIETMKLEVPQELNVSRFGK